MKKIGLIVKEASESRVKTCLKGSGSFFVVKYSGLSSPDITALRLSLKGSQADFFVVKNSVARRALKSAGMENAVKYVDGPCGIIFVKEEPVDVSKVLFNFLKEHEKFQFGVGFLKDQVLEKKDIEALAKLPSKQALRQQLVVALNSPISRLVCALNGTLSKFVICLDKIKEKKSKEQTPRA
ncbi:MAG: 50S ribosomal protein L10 [Candidatus Omnitrophica bacterium]|nr:50S ribosomal protein L10 [Candidatus Omnitrophota bacterium]